MSRKILLSFLCLVLLNSCSVYETSIQEQENKNTTKSKIEWNKDVKFEIVIPKDDLKKVPEEQNTITQKRITKTSKTKTKHVSKDIDQEKENYVIYNVTAYTAGYESTGKRRSDPDYGITASGKRVREKHTAACPKSMEFGTKLYIPYFDNTFVCEDRGGKIKEGKLDIYMDDLDEALEFGRRNLEVLVIEKSEEDKTY